MAPGFAGVREAVGGQVAAVGGLVEDFVQGGAEETEIHYWPPMNADERG
jgi:hypothetical protein